jgi:Bacterial PH domain
MSLPDRRVIVRRTEDGTVLAKLSIVPALTLALVGVGFVLLAALISQLGPEDANYPKIDVADAVVGVFIFSALLFAIALGIDGRRYVRVGPASLQVARGLGTRTFPWSDVRGVSTNWPSGRLLVASRDGPVQGFPVTWLDLPGGDLALAILRDAWNAHLSSEAGHG